MKPTSLSTLASLIASYALLIPHALANTEKTIFIAPDVEKVPQYTFRRAAWHLGDLPKLTHANHTLSTNIEAGFPNASFPSGPETWVLLDELKPGKRYEARLSWAASQPTSFDVEAFNLSEILANREEFFPSLACTFSSRISSRFYPVEPHGVCGIRDGPSSRMLLRIHARADYFTHVESLMRDVPPVPVHIILDPFHFNILPHSLFLTVIVVAIVAVLPISLVVLLLDC